MKATIKADDCYKVNRIYDYDSTACYGLLKDGNKSIMIAEIKSYYEYQNDVIYGMNEAAHFCECFVTAKGNAWIYWRDEEIDEDYLTKIANKNTKERDKL
jgi:hypothetical protein